MSVAIQTPLGHAIPPAPHHAITVHLPLWSNLVRWVDGDAAVVDLIKSMYPRMMLHRDVKEVCLLAPCKVLVLTKFVVCDLDLVIREVFEIFLAL